MTGNNINTERYWKHWPKCWYVVARADKLPVGGVISGHLAGQEWVLYRSKDNAIHAMDGFCPHMGAHLKQARVVDNTLVCGLHALQLVPQFEPISAQVSSQIYSGSKISICAWHCEEHLGLIWLHPPTSQTPPLPFKDKEEGCYWLAAEPIKIAADWRAMICNGYDLSHMQAVHQREVIDRPRFSYTPEGGLQMDYATRILQEGGVSSWVMKRLSGGKVVLNHTCIGTSIFVQSRVGRFKTQAIFSALPLDKPKTPARDRQCLALGAIGIERHVRFPHLRLLIARALFLSFLRKDFRVIEGMDMNVDAIDDVGVQAIRDYQYGLSDLAIIQ